MRQLKITKQVTNRDNIAFEKYLSDISRKETITPEEEIQLSERIKQGDKEALDKLITANLRFVVSVAKQYQHQGMSLQDLVNEGNLGLIKAAKKFDATRGFKFISYAVWWIRQSILHAISVKSRMVRLPLNKINMMNKIYYTTEELKQEYKREPTSIEIADKIDVNYEIVKEMKLYPYCISMDAPLKNDDDDDFNLYDKIGMKDSISPDNKLMKESLANEINNTLKILKPHQAKIIKMYYGIGEYNPMTLDEIGEELDLTKERIRQLKNNAIRKLQRNSIRKKLKTYL